MPKRRHEPRRTCVACRQEGTKDELIRLVRTAEGAAVDSTGRAPGRGAYLHRRLECLEEARRRGALTRALNAPVGEEVWAALRAGPA
ncbi:MAG TPA: YlxR family protein [Candidatus Dormibacteraeota bacterium]